MSTVDVYLLKSADGGLLTLRDKLTEAKQAAHDLCGVKLTWKRLAAGYRAEFGEDAFVVIGVKVEKENV